MRLCSFEADGRRQAGLLHDEAIVPLGRSMRSLLRDWPSARAWLADPAGLPEERLAPTAVRLLAPIPDPPKVVGIGMNYVDHCREQGIDPPAEPVVFAKLPTSVIGPGEAVRWPAGLTDQVDWEVELAVVIGRTAVNVAVEHALDHVAGYTIANDVSARDLQVRDGQFVRSKSLDTFCPLGPWLVTRDELPDPGDLALSLRLNGREMQRSSTAMLVFGVPELIAWCSRSFTLEPGDVILTGTPPGVGAFAEPPVFLAADDEMVAEIEGLGTLSTPVLGPV